MKEALVLVPLVDNEGVPFTTFWFEQLENRLLRDFGGYTLEATVSGAWKARDGKIHKDVSQPYCIAYKSDAKLQSLLNYIKEAFKQEKIYAKISQYKVLFI